MQYPRAKLIFHAFSVVGRKIPYVALLNISFVNFLEIVKQLSTEETQPIPKTSILHQLKGKVFFINY